MYTLELDENLIIRMAAGDNDAFRDLYQQTSSAVYGFALSILRNRQDAEDVMHDTYIRTYHSAVSYRPMGKPMAWLLTIVRNLCYNRLRSGNVCDDLSQYESLGVTEDTGLAGALTAEDTSEAVLDRMMLEKALGILDFEDRQIVILHAMTGMKHREIGELLELPTNTVISKYNRALKKMRNEINGEEAAK